MTKDNYQRAVKLMDNLKRKYNMDLHNFHWRLTTGRTSIKLDGDLMKFLNCNTIGEVYELIGHNYRIAENMANKESEKELLKKGWIYERVPLAKHKKELNQVKKEI